MLRRCLGLSSVAWIGAAFVWCGLLLVSGCGDPVAARGQLVAVQGKVTLDRQPLTGGVINFFPILGNSPNLPASATLSSQSELGDDGSFNLSTAGKSGAPLGKYRVYLVPKDDSAAEQWGRVPRLYTMASSPLVVEVVENKSAGGYDIRLSSKDKPKRTKEILEEKRKWRKGKQ